MTSTVYMYKRDKVQHKKQAHILHTRRTFRICFVTTPKKLIMNPPPILSLLPPDPRFLPLNLALIISPLPPYPSPIHRRQRTSLEFPHRRPGPDSQRRIPSQISRSIGPMRGLTVSHTNPTKPQYPICQFTSPHYNAAR